MKLEYNTDGIVIASKVDPLGETVIAHGMYFGEQITNSGLIITDDDGKDRGIHARWAQVFAVGPDQNDVKPGQWILIEHGRWGRIAKAYIRNADGTVPEKPHELRKIDPKCILLVSDENPEPNKFISYGKE